jgi:hypothetical protein
MFPSSWSLDRQSFSHSLKEDCLNHVVPLVEGFFARCCKQRLCRILKSGPTTSGPGKWVFDSKRSARRLCSDREGQRASRRAAELLLSVGLVSFLIIRPLHQI